MTNNEMLQKLMLGKEDTQEVELEINGEKYTFNIRPLTSGELVQLQTIEKQGFKVKVGMQNGRRQSVETNLSDVDVNVGEFTEYQAESMYTCIALSLDVNIEDVKLLPTGIPELLFDKVIEISGLSDADLTAIKTFRQDKGSEDTV